MGGLDAGTSGVEMGSLMGFNLLHRQVLQRILYQQKNRPHQP
jgi:hypothetical protein